MKVEDEREVQIKKEMERVEAGKTEQMDNDNRDSDCCDSEGD